MEKEKNILWGIKSENRNRIYNTIRKHGCISCPSLIYELQLSRPTVTQNINELLLEGLIIENGFFRNTGGRKAKGYSISENIAVSFGIDITKNHVTVIAINTNTNIIYEKRVRLDFERNDEYRKTLMNLIREAVVEKQIDEKSILGVGIAVPGLVTKDYRKVFSGKILNFDGLLVDELAKFIPYECRMYNDANAGGYAEISYSKDIENGFYISLSNNIGGAIFIDNKAYCGEGTKSGEVGHITLVPNGKKCYCGKRGCFEAYCNARVLSERFDGEENAFFKKLKEGDETCRNEWENYLNNVAIAVNDVRMLFDCKIILGGYIGAFMEDYKEKIEEKVMDRNPFDTDASFIRICKVRRAPLALGSALPFIHEFWEKV